MAKEIKITHSKMSELTQKWVKLTGVYRNNYSGKYSVSELAKLTNIPQQSVSRYINDLLKYNLINFEIKGSIKNYYFDLNRSEIIKLLNILEIQISLKFQINHKKIGVIIDDLLNYCDSIIIFGSYANESYDLDSDLDIVLVNVKDKGKVNEIKNKYSIDINEHIVTYKEFESSLKKKNPLGIEILHNHLLFGNISKLVDLFVGGCL